MGNPLRLRTEMELYLHGTEIASTCFPLDVQKIELSAIKVICLSSYYSSHPDSAPNIMISIHY